MHFNGPASGLPDYVTGSVPAGEPYVLQTNVLVFAPADGGIASTATKDGVLTSVFVGEDQSRDVATATVKLTSGTSTELVFTVTAPAPPGGAPDPVTPQLILTPGVTPWVTSVQPYAGCTAPTQ